MEWIGFPYFLTLCSRYSSAWEQYALITEALEQSQSTSGELYL